MYYKKSPYITLDFFFLMNNITLDREAAEIHWKYPLFLF